MKKFANKLQFEQLEKNTTDFWNSIYKMNANFNLQIKGVIFDSANFKQEEQFNECRINLKKE